MAIGTFTFIFAEPENEWIYDIITSVIVNKLPRELFGGYELWNSIITQNPFIQKVSVLSAQKKMDSIRNEMRAPKEPLFPLDHRDSETNFVQYIERDPIRIIITGDVASSVVEVGELAAKEFKTLHINPKELIRQQIIHRTKIGNWLFWNIKEGRGIPIWIVMYILQSELKKNKYRHKGYVLSGFPIIPETEQVFDAPCVFRIEEDYTAEHKYDDFDVDEKITEEMIEEEDEMSSLTSSLASEESIWEDDDETLSYIQDQTLMYVDGEYDLVSSTCAQKQLDIINKLWCRPEYAVYLDTNVYTDSFAAIIDDLQTFYLFYNKANVIHLDTRIGIKNVFKSLCTRFEYINYKVNYPCIPLNLKEKRNLRLEDLCSAEKVLPNYKWWISDFGIMCPVNLYAGRRRLCNSQFPVRYLRYIFFCYSYGNRKTFMEYPGKYLKLFPTCRVAVIGPHRTGKTTLCKQLAHYFNAEIYNTHITQAEAIIAKENKKEIKDKSLKKEVKELETLRLQEQAVLKQKTIEEWNTCVLALANEMISKAFNKGKKNPPPFELFNNKLAEKYYLKISKHRSNSDAFVKRFVLDNAIFNKANVCINTNDFLRWLSVNPDLNRLCKQYVIDSAPLDIIFWEELMVNDELPDCVFFFKSTPVKKMLDVYSLLHDESCINEKMILNNLCSTFNEWKDHFKPKMQAKLKPKMPMDENTIKYIKHLVGIRFKESFDYITSYLDLQSYLQEHHVPCIEIDISKQTWTETISNTLIEYISSFQPKAVPLHGSNLYSSSYIDDTEIEEHLGSIGSSSLLYSDFIDRDGTTVSELTLSPSHVYGSFQDWCPVLLKNSNTLIRGDLRFAAEYRNRIYVMHSKDALVQFLADPLSFIKKKPTVPPPRIFLVGLSHKNKAKFAESLALSLRVTAHPCMQYVTSFPYYESKNEEFSLKALRKAYKAHKNSILHDIYSQLIKGGVFYGFPIAFEQLGDLITQKLYPECVLMFDDQEDLLIMIYRYLTVKYALQQEYAKERDSNFQNSERNSVEVRRQSKIPDPIPLPKSIKQDVMNKCKTIMQPFLLEALKIEDACLKLRIPIIKVPKNYKYYTGAMPFFVNQINQSRSRAALFEDVQTITMKESEVLLDSGYYLYSRFKKSCPVDVERLITLNHYTGMYKQGNVHPCVYRDFVYFISGKKNLKDFKKNPLAFVDTCNPPQSPIPIRVAFIGAENVDVTTICDSMAQELGLRIFSQADFPDGPITETALIDLLKMYTSSTPNGIILNNLALTPNMLLAAAEHNVDFTIVFIMVTSFKQLVANWYNLNQSVKNCPLLMIPKVQQKFDEAQERITRFRKSIDISLFNIRYLDGDVNSWSTWEKVKYELIKTVRCISGYKVKLIKQRCANLSYLNLFYSVIFIRAINHYYCQVCLSIGKLNAFKYYYVNVPPEFYTRDCQKLLCKPYGYLDSEIYTRFNFTQPFQVSDEKPPLATEKKSIMSTFQYKRIVYWTCSDHTIDFMMCASSFYEDSDKLRPLYIPFLVIGYIKEFVAYSGYCPVAYLSDGKLTKGDMNLSVYYRKKVYLMSSIQNTLEFLSYPEKYRKANLNVCLRPKSFGNPFFCGLEEERIAHIVTDLSMIRPKHFALSAHQTASTFIGLKLKTSSESGTFAEYWLKVLHDFVDECKTFDNIINKYRENFNPHILMR